MDIEAWTRYETTKKSPIIPRVQYLDVPDLQTLFGQSRITYEDLEEVRVAMAIQKSAD